MDIRRFQIDTLAPKMLVSDQTYPIGLDFDFDTNHIYWSDMVNKTIRRAPIDNAADIEVIIKGNLDIPEGFALDWINKKLYWTDADSKRPKIEVADLNGKNRLILIQKDLHKPRAIAVHPFDG